MSVTELHNALLQASSKLTPITAQELRTAVLGAQLLNMQLFHVGRTYVDGITGVLGRTFEFKGARQRIQKEGVAEYALTRLRLGHSIDAIVADIEYLMSAEKFSWEHVRAVQGLRVDKRIEFSDRVYLDNPRNLPVCSSREILFRIDALGNRIPPQGLHGIVGLEAALVVHLPSTIEEALPQEFHPPADTNNFEIAQKEVKRCFACVALAGNCAPRDAGQTTWTYLPGYLPSLNGGGASGGQIDSVVMNEAFDVALTKELYTRSLSMTDHDWGAIELAAFQLIEARSATSLVNRAICLRVAAEIALMHNSGDPNSTTEITHKLAERGGALIGHTPEAKFAAFQELKSEYGATSTAIHTGRLAGDKEPALSSLDGHIAVALRELIALGRFPPNWNKLVYGIT